MIRSVVRGLALLAFVAEAAGASGSTPSIRFNQLGFLPDGPKRAVVETDALAPLEWRVENAAGAIEGGGVTQVFGSNAASGEHVHLVDFSALQTAGEGFQLIVGEARSRPFAIADDIFDRLRDDALAYFYHCAPQTCWADHADAYALNEVAINWNAPLFWVAAFVAETR